MPLQHRPLGDGHPYATSPDQRHPVRPDLEDAVTLGVLAVGVDSLICELRDPDGVLTQYEVLPGTAVGIDVAAFAGGDGHLAQAQAARGATSDAWHVELPPLGRPGTWSYRFVGASPAESLEGAEVTPWFEVSPGSWRAEAGTLRIAGIDAESHERVVPGSIAWWSDGKGTWRVRFALALAQHEHVVGFGERFEAVDLRGRRLDAVVFEQYKSQGKHARTYLPMPFAHVIGGEGWGFHVSTSRRTWFDVGATTAEELWIESQLDGGSSPSLDVDLWTGEVHEVLGQFLDQVGRAEELPGWVFDLWASGNEWNTQELVTTRMDTHRDLDIPVGVVVVEAWSDELGIMLPRDARYTVDPDGGPRRFSDLEMPSDGAWPDLRAWVDDMHARGIKVLLWQIPLLKTAETIALDEAPWTPSESEQVLAEGAALERSGHLIREADGSAYRNRGWWFPRSLMPDLSTPEGRENWTSYRRYLLEDLDIDGFKTDGGEHAWGDDLRYGDGSRGDAANNLNPVNYARAFGDLLRSHNKAPVTFSRAGFTGSQAHGVFWAGDEDSTWEAMRSSLNAGLTASACGIVYWGWDLAGFSGPVPDAELYLRAVAFSAFLPVMQYHSEFNHHQLPLRDRTPWNVADLTGDDEVVEVFRRYAHLRSRLRPYLEEQARESIATSRPFLRGLWADSPHDEQVWAFPHQFLLGSDILVSPVTQPGATTANTYLPAGTWRDAWTGEVVTGGQIVLRDAPRDVVPVYVRDSAWGGLESVFRP